MIKVNVNEMQYFAYCVETLMRVFVENQSAGNEQFIENRQVKFRVSIDIPFLDNGKKFDILSNIGKFKVGQRELECIQCLKDGFTAVETGKKLFITQRTVESHLENIKIRLNCYRKRDILRILFG